MKRYSIISCLFVTILAGMLYVLYHIHKQHEAINWELSRIKNSQKIVAAPKTEAPSIIPSTNQAVWLEVQKRAQNTVVQIICQLTQHNLLEPYRAPQQGESTGSGFFISNEGDIVTNYHVVEDATSVQIQLSLFGREPLEVEVKGVCPERDIALLKLKPEAREKIIQKLGSIPFLPLGDSDKILKTHELLALGYPLGLQVVKSTQGIVSGHEWIGGKSFIQITAPLNPGNSGGPALNQAGEVVGINSAGIPSAQNIGFIIPINEVRSTLADLYKIPFLRKPTLGCIFTLATPELTKFLGNPDEGGWYISRIFPNSILEKAGIKEGDMLYEINGFPVDRFGEVSVPWSEDKVPALALFNRCVVGDTLDFVIYRKGSRKDFHIVLQSRQLLPIRQIYPLYETADYEVIGGMVVMELTLNHIFMLLDRAPFLMHYTKLENQTESKLLITHIFPNSALHKARLISPGAIIEEINGIKVNSLQDFRAAMLKPQQDPYLTMRCVDRAYDNMFVVLPMEKMVKEEPLFAQRYFYKPTAIFSSLCEKYVTPQEEHREKTA